MRRALPLFALLLWATVATAAIPQTISYQGILREADGAIVADGNYNLTFKLYAAAVGGAPLWAETQALAVQDGVFNALLGSVTAIPLDFSNPYYLGVAVNGSAELTPRVALASAPYSLNADRLDGLSSGSFAGAAHTHALDALSDVNAPAPANGQVLSYSAGQWVASTLGAGDDGDWVISGSNIYRQSGKVGIGLSLLEQPKASEASKRAGGRDAADAKLSVYSNPSEADASLYARFDDFDGSEDGRAAIYALRSSGWGNPGSGPAVWQTNCAVTGANNFGDPWSFGIAGYSELGNAQTGGVLGAELSGNVWGALGYRDAASHTWGLYTPFNAHVGGRLGVGTSAPVRALEVENASGDALIARVTTTTYGDFVAVEGYSRPIDYYGIGGRFEGGYYGLQGLVNPTGNSIYTGVYGAAIGGIGGNKYGVVGSATGPGTNYGLFGYADGGTVNYAGYFTGNVHVAGTLSKAAGAFKIDHPLDPANRTLSHSFVESPDMMNVYNGNIVLGADGSAWVEMPAWFEALNRDCRYQLTCIGGFAPVYVATKMAGNRFRIAGGTPGLEVSWQVTGIRQDAYANAHRIPVEEWKADQDRGRYLNPEALGQPEALGVDYEARHPELRKGK